MGILCPSSAVFVHEMTIFGTLHPPKGRNMQIIIEIDGILINLRQAYWQAYQAAMKQIGLACADEGSFWRVIRRGDPISTVLQGGKLHHISAFESAFSTALVDPSYAKKLELHEDASQHFQNLKQLGTCHYVTQSAHADALSGMLTQVAGSGCDAAVTPLSDAEVNAQFQSLVGSARPVIVLSAGERLLQVADALGYIPIGIASGACIAKRMPRFGAIATYRNASAFCEARTEGDPVLVRAGIQGDRR